MNNLELKVAWPEPFTTLTPRLATLGATDEGRWWQRDTYFTVSSGRLKLREWGEAGSTDTSAGSAATHATLIAYHRPDQAGTRESVYTLVAVPDGPALLAALAATCGVLTTVEKVRHLCIYRHTRIHLDTVQHLGTFLELETVVSEPFDGYEAEHTHVVTVLGLAGLPSIPGSYSDLFCGNPYL